MERNVDTARLSRALATRCNADGEFRLASRYWDGRLDIAIGDELLAFSISSGAIAETSGASEEPHAPGYIGLSGPRETWEKVLAPVPPPMFNDIMPAAAGGLVREGEDEIFWQYSPAVRRLIDILREEVNAHAAV